MNKRTLQGKPLTTETLFEFYNTIAGDADEKAYYSEILVQRYFQQRKTHEIKKAINANGKDLVLDIGCGSGVQIQKVTENGYIRSIGIDVNRNAIEFARSRNLPNAEFIIADAQHLPIKPARVTKVICAEIIEHLETPDTLISEIYRVLEKDGEVTITTPNNNRVWKIYEYLWDRFGRGRNYGETHLKLFSETELHNSFFYFSTCKTKTIFFISPLLALSNLNWLLELGKRIDCIFEQWGWGVSIILYAKK
jgi:SAM-dependent methyltransferase